MADEISGLIEQRQVMRGIIDMLAEPLTGDARAEFLITAERRLNDAYPAPGKHHMRMYLRSV